MSFPLEEPFTPLGSPKNDLGPPGPQRIVGGSVPESRQCIYEGVKVCVCVCVATLRAASFHVKSNLADQSKATMGGGTGNHVA